MSSEWAVCMRRLRGTRGSSRRNRLRRHRLADWNQFNIFRISTHTLKRWSRSIKVMRCKSSRNLLINLLRAQPYIWTGRVSQRALQTCNHSFSSPSSIRVYRGTDPIANYRDHNKTVQGRLRRAPRPSCKSLTMSSWMTSKLRKMLMKKERTTMMRAIKIRVWCHMAPLKPHEKRRKKYRQHRDS